MHHEFAHAAIRGAGYAAGREAFHAMGLGGTLVFLAILALVVALGRKA